MKLEKCKHCGLCATVCPTTAIEFKKKERKPKPIQSPEAESEKPEAVVKK